MYPVTNNENEIRFIDGHMVSPGEMIYLDRPPPPPKAEPAVKQTTPEQSEASDATPDVSTDTKPQRSTRRKR